MVARFDLARCAGRHRHHNIMRFSVPERPRAIGRPQSLALAGSDIFCNFSILVRDDRRHGAPLA